MQYFPILGAHHRMKCPFQMCAKAKQKANALTKRSENPASWRLAMVSNMYVQSSSSFSTSSGELSSGDKSLD
jgi:hypothetical protein